MNFTPSKTLALLISNKINPNRQPTLQMNNTGIEEFSPHNYLSLIFTTNLSWVLHINEICDRLSKKIVIERLLICVEGKLAESICYDTIFDTCKLMTRQELHALQICKLASKVVIKGFFSSLVGLF